MLNVAVLTSSRAPGIGALTCDPNLNVTAIVRDDVPPLRVREPYDAETASILRDNEADIVILCCYLKICTRPLLDAFRGRMINLHDGTSRYPGLHATRDAIFAGERETFAIAHLVDEFVDHGKLLVRSDPFAVAPLVRDALSWGAIDIVKAYAYAHREWVIRSAWGTLMRQAVAALAEVAA
jgi:folate-dependent phosphoribosylglycinamide formyltransferase PurN